MQLLAGGNKLLPTARKKGHREVVEREDWTGGGCIFARDGRDNGSHCVPMQNIRRVKDERGRREWARKEGMRWMGQLECASI